MIRLVVEGALAAGPREVRGDDHHYLFRVRRLTLGDALVVSDGAGREADATVAAIDGVVGRLELAPPRAAAGRRGPAITALLPLIKGERMDLALEKLVELGAVRVVPFAADRSIVRLDPARAQDRHRRYQAIARAAAAQSRAAHRCEVAPIGDLAGALAAVDGAGCKLLFSERAAAPPARGVLTTAAGAAGGPPTAIAILTGPEGGLTDGEHAAAVAAGFAPVSLGGRILRAETAAIAALTAVGFALGDLGR